MDSNWKKKGPTLWESWGEESLPNWPYQNGCIPAPPPTQPNPGLLGLGLCQAVEPCCLKTLKMCGNTYLPRKSQTGEVYTFPQTLLFNLLRWQRSLTLPPFSSGFPSLSAKWNLGEEKCLRIKQWKMFLSVQLLQESLLSSILQSIFSTCILQTNLWSF